MAIRFAIEGDLRFISHHDTMRAFERAIARAELPVKFSEGFNPRPRISLPLPRSVGIASAAEVLVIELSEPVEPSAALARLSQQMPQNLRLQEAWILEGSGSLHPRTADYELPVPAELMPEIDRKCEQLMAQSEWLVQRTAASDKRDGQIDLRPFLVSAAAKGDALRWTVHVTDSGSIRPSELISAVGLDPPDWQHRVLRRHVAWSQQPSVELLPTAVSTELV